MILLIFEEARLMLLPLEFIYRQKINEALLGNFNIIKLFLLSITPSTGFHFLKLFMNVYLQQYLSSGDWDDVEDLEEKLESYKSERLKIYWQ